MSNITEERPPIPLLPCPFCQCASVVSSLYRGSYFVLCEACETRGPPSIDSAIAVEAWNRRASAPAITEERLVDLLAKFNEPPHFGRRLTLDDTLVLGRAIVELQLLRASAPVLSEEQREALEAGAKLLEQMAIMHSSIKYGDEPEATALKAQAALLRAMAQQTKVE